MNFRSFLRTLCLVIAYSFIFACSNQNTVHSATSEKSPRHQWAATITAHNHDNNQHNSAPIYIPFIDLGLDAADTANIRIFSESEAIDFEAIDSDGNGEKDGFFALRDLAPKQTQVWQLKRGGNIASSDLPVKLTQAEISIKKGGFWAPHPNVEGKQAYQGGAFKNVSTVTLPEWYTDHSNWIRYEGPGIESDKVAYRIYLDHRNGFDIFGKTLSEPILQKVGQDGYESYHKMRDWGMDILKVGSSLGTGGFGFWNGENLTFVTDTESRSARIIENGHLYSSVAIEYNQWLVNGERRDVSALISMRGGSRLARTLITMDKALANLAIGVVKHPGTEFLKGKINGDRGYSYIGSWGKQSENGDNLGMAVIFKTKELLKVVDDTTSYVALMQPQIGAQSTVLEYYFVAAWQGEHDTAIDSKQAFTAYLDAETQKLSDPIIITVIQ